MSIVQTFAMTQGEVLCNDQVFQATFHCPPDDPKRAGICCGLSMLWIRNFIVNHNSTPEQRKAALRAAVAYVKAGQTQDIHHKSPPATSDKNWIQNEYSEALCSNTLRPVISSYIYEVSSDSRVLAKKMEKAATSTKSYRLYFLKMRVPGREIPIGHVVASYASSGKIFGWGRHLYFFDCESGEFKIDVGETAGYLTAWLDYWKSRKLELLELRSFGVEAGV